MKPRILFCNEASYLSTGYGVYGMEVLKRLHDTGKYELAELASYGDVSDPSDHRWEEVPWKFYPVMPNRNNQLEVNEYTSRVINEFGCWKFEQTCVDFKPDIVWDIRDWWMFEYQERSPFRPFYHWCIMPTVDAIPQDEAWLATFSSANAVSSYSDWGLDVLKKQGIRTIPSAPPGADFETFKPVPDKRVHKSQMGLPEDALVIGTIMRNQKRKLYPDLINSFAKFLREAPTALAKRTYLYLHVNYPDIGWDIPRLIKSAGVGSRTVFTYNCHNCGISFPSFYMDAKAFCRRCGKHAATLPTTLHGVARNVLANALNFMDVFVQYANSEGFGMPQVEAAACGVPVFSVDYSAMSDVVRKIKGTPINGLALVPEAETGCNRAVPDNNDLVKKLINFLSLPESVRLKRGHDGRNSALKYYNYDRTAKVWEDHFDSVQVRDHSQTWDSPARIHTPQGNIPPNLTDEEFIRWGITHLAGRPELLNGYLTLRLSRDLTWGQTTGDIPRSVFSEFSWLGVNHQPVYFNRESALQQFIQICKQKNFWEEVRVNGMH
jgi:glycosyltransferase involved in cell wall biosynthesis